MKRKLKLKQTELFARVILHENDHLIGKMIPDRVSEKLKKMLEETFKTYYMDREIKIDYPITEM